MRRSIISVSLLSIACGAESLDVGNTDVGATAGNGGSSTAGGSNATGGTDWDDDLPAPPVWPTPSDCVSASNLDIVGTWEGAIRNFSFETVVPLRLEIVGASELGGVCGTLRWGDGPPPEPIADPERGWPERGRLFFEGQGEVFLYEGATYTLLDGVVRGQTVRFIVDPRELWKEWCALQPPIRRETRHSYACMPEYVELDTTDDGSPCRLVPAEGPPLGVESRRCAICSGPICTCNAESCGAAMGPEIPRGRFDLTFEGDRASGGPPSANLETYAEMTDVVLNRVE
jgi:hypothetical protein